MNTVEPAPIKVILGLPAINLSGRLSSGYLERGFYQPVRVGGFISDSFHILSFIRNYAYSHSANRE
jgi:hypothetical protein